MFETIDQIDWQALNDAYGPSVGTARRIRDLASPNQGTPERACRDLGCTINHQGAIYAVSAAAWQRCRSKAPVKHFYPFIVISTNK